MRLTLHALSLGLRSLSVVSRNGESGRLSVKLLGRLIASEQDVGSVSGEAVVVGSSLVSLREV